MERVGWVVPEEEGSYWLTARLTGTEGRAVLSQRFVRAFGEVEFSAGRGSTGFLVLGASDTSRSFFQRWGLRTVGDMRVMEPGRDVVVVWDAGLLSEGERALAGELCSFAGAGGRVVVLSTETWGWRSLSEIQVAQGARFSRVFKRDDVAGSWLDRVEPDWLVRWNGYPGTVAYGVLEGGAMAEAEVLLWAKEPGTVVGARVPASAGDGKIEFYQLDLRRRVDVASEFYDVAAERVLLELLGAGVVARRESGERIGERVGR